MYLTYKEDNEKNDVIISTDTKNALSNIKYPFLKKQQPENK